MVYMRADCAAAGCATHPPRASSRVSNLSTHCALVAAIGALANDMRHIIVNRLGDRLPAATLATAGVATGGCLWTAIDGTSGSLGDASDEGHRPCFRLGSGIGPAVQNRSSPR